MANQREPGEFFGIEDPDDSFADPRSRYRLCRAAFTLGAIALGLQSAELALSLLAQFGIVRELGKLFQDPNWSLFIGTPITWSAVIASYLLIGRWPEPWWSRRVGLLVLMNSLDLLFWASDNGQVLGLELPGLQDRWVRHFGGVMQWFELMLFASLAARTCEHLGRPGAWEAARSARSFAIVGVILWAIVLVGCTSWDGWPPRFQIPSIEAFLLLLASRFLLGLTAFQVMLLCALAGRASRQVLVELDAADRDHELLRPRSDDSFDDGPAGGKESDPWA